MTAAQDLPAWLRLAATTGVGPDTARKLLGAFGLPENIFSADTVALAKVVSARVAQALLAPTSTTTQALIDRTLTWAGEPGNHVLTLGDPAYPARLLEIADPPIMLYVKGRIELLAKGSLAVVGSRNATAQGLANAEEFSAALGGSGLTIVSGLALGIDTAAHRGSLRAAVSSPATAGSTIAVIGTGADIVYPARNRALAHEIAEYGCIVSEYPLGVPAISSNFPRRNRIISGLAQAVLVVEAAARSGSLITARMAAEQGRDVFAIPGSIHSPLAKGCHQLIKQGAKLVESAQDVLEELQSVDLPCVRLTTHVEPTVPAEPDLLTVVENTTNPVLHAIGFDPVRHDDLASRCGLTSAELAAQLLTLELEGKIEMLAGGAYQRIC
ncbi:MAG: DNA-processing protein DprA [Pseudomonadota bacterium]